ncbi:response regulator transcription factor [Bacillus sp. JJ722]|uniref:response regulator transcription factor n=1 Tax=Bacillus sp. JJ722 TaxID=3122973 RepID=UPI002FFED2D2
MRLTTEEYDNVLYAVEELAVKQINTNLDRYRMDVLQILYNAFKYSTSLFWIMDNHNKLVDPIMLNIDLQPFNEYKHYFHKLDFLHPQNLEKKKRVQKLDDVISPNNYIQTEYYNAFMKKNLYLDEMAIYFEFNGELVGVIGLIKSKGEEKFTPLDCMKVNYLVKQIESGLHVQLMRHSLRNRNESILTDREKEIINYLERGKKNIEIANLLYVSTNTIKKHLQNLYRRFGVSSRTELLYKINKK